MIFRTNMAYRHQRPFGSSIKSCLGAVALCLFVAMPVLVSADVIVAIHDWDTTPDPNTWGPDGASASVAVANDGDDFLQISFPGGIDPGPGDQWYETISTPSADLLAGGWITDYWIEFDFWADDVVPDTLQIRWGNDDVGGNTWGNTIDTSGIGIDSWGTLRTDTFSDFSDWQLAPFVDQADFLADLDSIDWIGVYIERAGTDAEVYGIDDFKLMVPEPAEYLLLFAALGTALVAIRRKKQLVSIGT